MNCVRKMIEWPGSIERTQAEIASRELPLSQQAAKNVNGIIATRKPFGKINTGHPRRPGLGNSLMNGVERRHPQLERRDSFPAPSGLPLEGSGSATSVQVSGRQPAGKS